MFTIKNEDVVSADLLSVEEAKNIPQWIRTCRARWWLRSHSSNFGYAADVVYDGFVYRDGTFVATDDNAVRPALKVLNLPELEIGETVKVFNRLAQYIGDEKVLLCSPIFQSRFDENSNNYETSEVKQKLDEWFEQEKSEVK